MYSCLSREARLPRTALAAANSSDPAAQNDGVPSPGVDPKRHLVISLIVASVRVRVKCRHAKQFGS